MKTLYLIRRNMFRLFGVMFLIAMANSSCDLLSNPDDEGPGEWRITEIDGSIINVREEGVPLLCDPFDETYFPIMDDNLTYIQFTKRQKEPDLEGIPHELLNAGNPIPDTGDVFIFYFTFDNGYYSNSSLGDFGVQYLYESFVPGTFTYADGIWREDLLSGSIMVQTAGGGYSKFSVLANFASDTRIEGIWEWEEHTAWPVVGAPECDSDGWGSGTWVAEKK